MVMFPCLCIYDSYRFQRNYFISFQSRQHEPENDVDESNPPASGIEEGQLGGDEQEHKNGMNDEKLDEHNFFVQSTTALPEKTERNSPHSSGSSTELDLETTNLIRWILKKYYEFLHRFRWPVLLVALAALVICSYFASTLKVTECKSGRESYESRCSRSSCSFVSRSFLLFIFTASDYIQLLSDNQEYEKNAILRKKLLSDYLLKQMGSTAFVVWGLTPADTGDYSNPYTWTSLQLDESFDPSTPSAQTHLRDFCDSFFREDFADKLPDNDICPINKFDSWLQTQSQLPVEQQDGTYVDHCSGATGLPMNSDAFHPCLSVWAHQVNEKDILSWDNSVKIMMFPFKSRVRFNSPSALLGEEWRLIESWMKKSNDGAPTEASNAYFSSSDWWFYDTNKNVYDAATTSGAIAIGVAALVILVSSRSLMMTLFSAISVAFVLVSVAALMSALNWSLGFL